MTTEPGTVTEGDITIDSNHESADQIAVAFQDDPPPPTEDAPAVEAVEVGVVGVLLGLRLVGGC